MMKINLIDPQTSYNFSDYFKLSNYLDQILAYFGYSFNKTEYELPHSTQPLEKVAELRQRLSENLPHINLTNETARREFLIAPVLMEVVHYTQVNIKVEWPIMVNDQLKGTLDYYLESDTKLLIIEAKNADLESGFAQLAVELVALDQQNDNDNSHLYGAVSTGNIWQFGILDTNNKQITQDLNLFRVTADLEDLLRILIAILGK